MIIFGNNGIGIDLDCVDLFFDLNGLGGYNIMILDFMEFELGEIVNVVVDVDFCSIEGFNFVGNVGVIVGLELIGVMVIVMYLNGVMVIC